MDLYSHNNYFLSLIAGDKISIIDDDSDNKKLNEFANKYNYHLLFFKNNNNPEEFGEKNYKKRNIYLLDDKKILKNNKQYDFKYILFVIFHLEFILDLNEKIDHRKYKEYLKKFCDETDTKIYFYRENTNLFEIIGTSNKNIIELTYDLESDGSINSYKTKKTTKFNKDEQHIVKHPTIKKYDTIKQDYLNLKNYITSSIIKTEPNKLEKAIEDKENFYKQEKQNYVINEEKQKQEKLLKKLQKDSEKQILNIHNAMIKEQKKILQASKVNAQRNYKKHKIINVSSTFSINLSDYVYSDKGILNLNHSSCFFNSAIQLLRNIPRLEEIILTRNLNFLLKDKEINYNQVIIILNHIFMKIQEGIKTNMNVSIQEEFDIIKSLFEESVLDQQYNSYIIIKKFLDALDHYDNIFNYKKLFSTSIHTTEKCLEEIKDELQTENTKTDKINIITIEHTKNEINLNAKIMQNTNKNIYSDNCPLMQCKECFSTAIYYKEHTEIYLCNLHYKDELDNSGYEIIKTNINNATQTTKINFDTCEILMIWIQRHNNTDNFKNINKVLNYETITTQDYTYELKGCIIQAGNDMGGHCYYINYETKNKIDDNTISVLSSADDLAIIETNSYMYLYILKEIDIEYVTRNFDTLCIDFITILLNLSEDEIKHKKYTAIIIDFHNKYKSLLTNYENKFTELINKEIVQKANTQEPKIILKIYLDLITFINDKINISNIKIIINKDTILVDFTKHIEKLLEVILSLPTKNLTYLFTYLFIKIFLKISQAEYILIAELSPQTQPQSQQSQQTQTQPQSQQSQQTQTQPQPQPQPQTQTQPQPQPQPPPQTQTQTQP